MRMRTNEPWGYGMLWLIVGVLVFFNFIAFIFLGMGLGRWECIEERDITTSDCLSGVSKEQIEPQPCKIIWEKVCVKEAWIRNHE